MVTLLITSFLILAGITYAIYLWQRPSAHEEAEFQLPPARAVSLFDDDILKEESPRRLSGARTIAGEERSALLERAAAGDKKTLLEAQATRDAALYDEVLNTLVEQAGSEKGLLSLASYITRSAPSLRVNRRLAEKFIESWAHAPDRNSTAKMLHVAALSNDPGVYQTAIEASYQLWRDRKLTGVGADELRQLMESEFWILAPGMRNSGSGFVLKRRLAQLRRQLVAAAKQSEG